MLTPIITFFADALADADADFNVFNSIVLFGIFLILLFKRG